MKYEKISSKILKSALTVHLEMGTGFLEKIYENCMEIECELNGLDVKAQEPLTVSYKNRVVGDHKTDLLINQVIIVELKAVKRLTASHQAQVLHYLKAMNKEVGLLLNFGSDVLEIKRLVL